jgi:hypothetical protein
MAWVKRGRIVAVLVGAVAVAGLVLGRYEHSKGDANIRRD